MKKRTGYFECLKKKKVNKIINYKDSIEILVWNVAGLKGKNKEFWDYIEKADVIGLMETWIEKENKVVEKWLDKNFKIEISYAKREKKRGRASGGMIIGVRKEINAKIKWITGEVAKVSIDGKNKKTEIYVVYMGKERDENKKCIEEEIEKEIDARIIVVGDFNARIGDEQGATVIGENDKRNSKDKEINNDGKKLVKWMEENGLIVMNGVKNGDEKGAYT